MKSKIWFVALALIMVALTAVSALAQGAPEITSTPVTTAIAGQLYNYQVEITPPDAGEAVFDLTQSPAGMTISQTGLVQWMPSADGTFPVTISVQDENSSDEQSYNLIVTSVPGSFQAEDVALGSSSQERDETIVGETWRITNTGTETISNIQLLVTGVDSRYQLEAVLPTTTLAGGESMDALFNVFVPLDQDAGETKIGTVQLTGTGASSLTRSIFLEAENNLVINEITARVDGSKDTLSSPGTIDDEADLGDEIELEIEIENTFDSDVEIDDITVELDAPDLDPADGLDDDLGALDNGDDDTVTFTFTLDPDDVDTQDEPFTITVRVEGEDENGANHGEEWDIVLEMDVQSRDIRIIRATPVPAVLTCKEDTLRIDYELRNVGSRDLDEAMLRFEVNELDFGMWIRDIELDEGDSDDYSAILRFDEQPEEGIYILEMTAYATDSTSDDTDQESISFEVKCATTSTGTGSQTGSNQTGSGINVNQGNVPVQVTGVPVASTTGTSSGIFRDAQTYLIIMGILVIVLLVVVIALAARLLNNRD